MTTRTASKSRKKPGRAKQKAVQNSRVRYRDAGDENRSGGGAGFRFPLFRSDDRATGSSSRRKKASKQGRVVGSSGAVRKSGRDYERMPSWRELDSKKNARAAGKNSSALDNISTSSMALIIVTFVAAFTLYIGNVHATQGELARFQAVQSENSELRMKLNRVKGEFDRMTSPAKVSKRARTLGLVEAKASATQVVKTPR